MEFANGTSFWDSDDRRKKAITFPRIDDTFKSDISAFLVIRPYETSEIGHADDKIHNEDIGIVI